jgi:hypothetical protein
MNREQKRTLQSDVIEVRNIIYSNLLERLEVITKKYGIDVNSSYIGNAYGALQDAHDWLLPSSEGDFSSECMNSKIAVKELRSYLNCFYSYITFEHTDEEMQLFIDELSESVTILNATDLFVDHILSRGECDVQE